MLIERDIESGVKTLIEEALADFDSVKITTAWGCSSEGEEFGVEKPEHEIGVAIAASAPEWDSYTTHECSLNVALSIAVRCECAPDAQALASVVEPISDMLLALQHNAEAVDRLSFDPFTADGVLLTGGDAPAFSSATNTWVVTRTFTLRGTLKS